MGCATLRHNVWSIAREASAAPAASFKSRYGKSHQIGTENAIAVTNQSLDGRRPHRTMAETLSNLRVRIRSEL
jgi:hypothetical protein